MAKVITVIMVVVFAIVIGAGVVVGNSLGHSAGAVLQDWSNSQNTATKTPPPLTTVIFGGDK